MEKYFLDKRFLVNGKKSHIHLDNFVSLGVIPDDGLPCQVLTYTGPTYWNYGWNYLSSILTATNGLNYSSATCPNLLKLGGSLIEDTTIDGSSTYKLDLLNLKELNVTSDIANLTASVSFYIQTPGVINTTAVTGQYLQLLDAGTGEVEYADLPDTSLLFDNVIYVSENGNDSTGTPYDMGKPYRNIYTAMTIAVSGDTVIVYPGLYSHTNGQTLIKPGVNLYLMEGAVVNVDRVGSSTLRFEGTHGIYGNGILTLATDLVSNAISINPYTGTAANNFITIELDRLRLDRVILNHTTYKELNINIKNITISSTWACALKIGLARTTYATNSVVNINVGNITGNLALSENVMTVSNLLSGSLINMKIGSIIFNSFGRGGLLYTDNNNINSTINIEVENIQALTPTNQVNGKAPLITGSSLCYSFKNINLKNFIITGGLYRPQVNNGNQTERGIIKFSGRIINYVLVSPVSTENILICSKRLSAITFDLNVVNESTQDSNALLAYKEGMIRIDSENALQKITGYIKVSRGSTLLSPNCVIYSLANVYASGAETGSCATLEDLTIVSAGCTSIQNNIVGITADTAKIPIKKVYTNVIPVNTQINYKIDLSVITDTYIR